MKMIHFTVVSVLFMLIINITILRDKVTAVSMPFPVSELQYRGMVITQFAQQPPYDSSSFSHYVMDVYTKYLTFSSGTNTGKAVDMRKPDTLLFFEPYAEKFKTKKFHVFIQNTDMKCYDNGVSYNFDYKKTLLFLPPNLLNFPQGWGQDLSACYWQS